MRWEVKVKSTNGRGEVEIDGEGWIVVSAQPMTDVHRHQRWVEVVFMRPIIGNPESTAAP